MDTLVSHLAGYIVTFLLSVGTFAITVSMRWQAQSDEVKAIKTAMRVSDTRIAKLEIDSNSNTILLTQIQKDIVKIQTTLDLYFNKKIT